MSPSPPASRGLLEALRAIAATLGEIACVRGALLGVEVREEIQRRKHMLLLAVLGAVCLHMALLLLTLLVAAAFWDTHRLLALAAMAVLYAAFGAAALARLRMALAASPEPFAATLGELQRDFAGLGAPR